MRANRGELCSGGLLRIDRHRWCAVAFEAAGEKLGCFGFTQAAGIEKELIRISRDIAAAGQLRHGNAPEREQMQRTFCAGHEEAVAIADPYDPRSAMGVLEFRGAH